MEGKVNDWQSIQYNMIWLKLKLSVFKSDFFLIFVTGRDEVFWNRKAEEEEGDDQDGSQQTREENTEEFEQQVSHGLTQGGGQSADHCGLLLQFVRLSFGLLLFILI